MMASSRVEANAARYQLKKQRNLIRYLINRKLRDITFYSNSWYNIFMFGRSIKVIVLLCILIGIHQTVRVHVHAGIYIIQEPNPKIPNIDKYRVTIDSQRVSISGGCNGLSSDYSIHNEHISYGGWVSTLMFCNEDHDQDVINLFQSASTVSALAGKIYFYNSSGHKIMKLKKVH